MSVALITGGSRGIGQAICKALAQQGYDIAFCYNGNTMAAEETLESLLKYGVNAKAYQIDVSKENEVENLFSSIKQDLGSIQVLVNNAGITCDNLLIRMSESDFSRVMDVNLKGAFLCSRQAVKEMMKARYGKIINISSVVALSGNSGQANYVASKSGLIGLTKAIACEYGSRGICVNAIAPGFIRTAMTDSLSEATKKEYLAKIPANRFGEADDIAGVVSFLASSAADYITGQVISVDGGMHM